MADGALQDRIQRLEQELAKKDVVIAGLRALLADRDAQCAKLAADVATLQKCVASLMQQRGRGRGLQLPPGQGLLFPGCELLTNAAAEEEGDDEVDDDESDSRQEIASSNRRRCAPGRFDTTGLPRERVVHDLPPDQRIDPASGSILVPVGQKVTEELDFKRARVQVIEHVQILYGLPPAEAAQRTVPPRSAPLPQRPLDNCIASANLLAWILVQKYCNHVPLYRQEAIFGREGLRLSRKTQCDWALSAASLLEPIVECLMTKIRAGPPGRGGNVMQLDDTPVKCQGGRGEANFTARLWAFVNPHMRGIVYRFTPGRDSASLAQLLGDFAGTLVGDAFSGNYSAARKVVDAKLSACILHAGCWAHVNCKFRDAEKESKQTARLFRRLIQQLYAIERECTEACLTTEARTELRQARSKPIVLEIFQHAWRLAGRFSDAGAMAKAIGYIRNQHRALRTFLNDGLVPIDNNACERAIRPIAVGRRNWLFAGSMQGGRAAATTYSLIASCNEVGVDPVDYLADVLVRLNFQPVRAASAAARCRNS